METLTKTDFVLVKLPACVNRALQVAVAADKKLLIVSRHQIFDCIAKTSPASVMLPCPCGNFGNLSPNPCSCEVEAITAHQRQLQIDFGSGYVYVEGYLAWRDFSFSDDFDESGLLLLKQAYQEFGLTAYNVLDMADYAAAIAKMEDSDKIHAQHIAEAISYRLH